MALSVSPYFVVFDNNFDGASHIGLYIHISLVCKYMGEQTIDVFVELCHECSRSHAPFLSQKAMFRIVKIKMYIFACLA